MGRLIFIVLAVFAAIWLLRRALRGPRGPRGSSASAPPRELLVECANCGVHLPRAEARQAGSETYCSAAHEALGPRRH